jgi:hypothetical protein
LYKDIYISIDFKSPKLCQRCARCMSQGVRTVPTVPAFALGFRLPHIIPHVVCVVSVPFRKETRIENLFDMT